MSVTYGCLYIFAAISSLFSYSIYDVIIYKGISLK